MAQNQNAIATISVDAIATETGFSTNELDLIRRDYAPKDTTDAELMLYAKVARQRGLDPFRRHIYLVSRYNSDRREMTKQIQVSIDGLRLTAQRSGKYAGQMAPRWCGQDGIWRDVWLESDPPAAAMVGVYHTDFREPMIGVARYASYVQTTKDGNPFPTWRSMPDVMLAKCAEALALRKAFPEEASGLYTSDEMGQANAIEGHGRIIDRATGEITDTHDAATEALYDWLREIGREYDDADNAIYELSKGKYRSVLETTPKYVRDTIDALKKLYNRDAEKFGAWLDRLAENAASQPEDPPMDQPELVAVAAGYTN